MAKAYFKEETMFVPVILEIETREEFDFLYELFNASRNTKKEAIDEYTDIRNQRFFDILADIKEEL